MSGNKVEFSLSMLFFWVKGSIGVDSRFVHVSMRNTVLDFIPAGKEEQSIPLQNISSTKISSKYEIKPMLLGAFAIFLSLGLLGDNFIGALFVAAFGVAAIGSSIESILVIQRAGSDYHIPVPFYEKEKLLIIQDSILQALSQSADKTDLNQFFDKKMTN